MDKETLSKYGWVVIVIIVLVLLMSFAAPFGQYFYDSTMAMVETLKNSTNIEQLFTPNGGKNDGTQEVVTNYTTEEIESNKFLYPIGETQPEYVVAEFNDDYTEVTITKNGAESNGLMMDWDFENATDISELPFSIIHNSTLSSVIIKEGVVSIGSGAFIGISMETGEINSLIQNVQLPESLCYIKDYAFAGCHCLQNVDISDNVISIGSNAFNTCSNLQDITIPNNITVINDYTFSGCTNLENIKIPNGVTSIGDYAFSDCTSLQSIEIPNSVISIDNRAFSNCSNLVDITIPENVTSINSGMFANCTSLQGITIPDGVTSIGSYAFYGCKNLLNITIPKNVTTINSSAFSHCTGLQSIKIPTSVTIIGNDAFIDCPNLKDMYYLGTADDWAKISFGSCYSNPMYYATNEYFNNELVTNVVFSNEVTEIKPYSFYFSQLTNVTMSNNLISIGRSAFYECNGIKTLIIPDSVKTIGSYAFYGCAFTDLTIGKGVTDITDAFSWCDKIENLYYTGTADDWVGITFGFNPMYYAEKEYFNGEPVKDIVLSENVTKINSSAFDGSTMTSISIPSSVNSIGVNVFEYCYDLTAINVSVNNEHYSSVDGVLFNKDKTTLIRYPMGNKSTSYKVPNNVEIISDNAFADCLNLNSLTVSDSVNTIGKKAFYRCKGLTTLIIPDSVKSIAEDAFDEIPYSLTIYCETQDVVDLVYTVITEYYAKKYITVTIDSSKFI